MKRKIIIYDGECGFCNKSLLYIAKKDYDNHYLFISNLSIKGKEILTSEKLTKVSKNTIIVIDNNTYLTKGKAIKHISKNILINPILKIIIQHTNLKLLNILYKIVAYNRLLLSSNSCRIPTKEILSKFILP